MTEDVKEVTVEVVDDPSEQQARSEGWKPKDEFIAAGGDESKWVAHDEFNRRKELFDAIHKANQRAKRAEETANALAAHHAKVEQLAYERAKNDLLKAKKEAARENNLEALVDIDEQLSSLEKPTSKVSTPTRAPELEDFASRNKWYAEDEDMQAYANGIGAKLERENPNMPVSEVLQIVEERTKKAFAHKFERPSTVATVTSSRTGPSTSAPRGKRSITYNDLDDDAKSVYNQLVKSPRNPNGKLTEAQYLREYAAISGLHYEEK